MAANDTPKALVEALDLIRGTKGPKPESLDVLESRQVSRVRTIFEDRNIVAIGIAEKGDRKTKDRRTRPVLLCREEDRQIEDQIQQTDSAGLERGRPNRGVHRCAEDRQSPPPNKQAPPAIHQGHRLGRMACFA